MYNFILSFLFFISFVSSFAQDGTLDNTFGVGGKLTVSIGLYNAQSNSIAIQADQKILLGGSAQNSLGTSNFALVRCNADGTLDNSFGTGGIQVTQLSGSSGGSKGALTIQNDGKILHGGMSLLQLKLLRLNSDGSLDNSFGINGIATTDFTEIYNDEYNAIVVLPNGKILMSGTGQESNADFPKSFLIQFNTDGTVDSSFGNGGKVFGSDYCEGSSMKIQSDGKIVIVGSRSFNFFAERFNADGSIDNSFGINGKVMTQVGTTGKANSMEIQNNGKIIVTGFAHVGTSSVSDFAIVRYNVDGSLDSSFGAGGKVFTSVGNSNSLCNSVRVDANGKILLSGIASGINFQDFAIVRYHENGVLDSIFGDHGKIITPTGNSYSTTNSMAIQGDGKILQSGYANAPNFKFSVVRYNVNELSNLKVSFDNHVANVFPNPFSVCTTINLKNNVLNADVMVFDAFGNEVDLIKNVSGNEIQIERKNLKNGIYFVKIIENESTFTTKIIVS
jgi:uncharacterized delta-60 repeat protein